MADHQAPPSPGFSRQEHWSGLPFPSSMHESEKWKWSHPVVSDSSRPHGLQPTRLHRPWDFPGKSTEVGSQCLLQFEELMANNFSKLMTDTQPHILAAQSTLIRINTKKPLHWEYHIQSTKNKRQSLERSQKEKILATEDQG